MILPQDMTAAERLAVRLSELEERRIQRSIEKPKNSLSNRSSNLGHPCLRYLVLKRTKGTEAEPNTPRMMLLFAEGRMHESDVKRRLEEAGVDLHGAEREMPENAYNVTGHGDVDVRAGGDACGVEIKGLNAQWFGQLNQASDFLCHPSPIVRKYYTQAQLYMYLSDLDSWLWIIKSKQSGALKYIPCKLDLEHVQWALDRAERINRHVAEGTEPEPINDPSVCRDCEFRRRACHPMMDTGKGAAVVNDPFWKQKVQERYQRAEFGKLYNQLDRELKDFFRSRAGSEEGEHHFFCEGQTITVKVGPTRTTVDFHDDEGQEDAEA